MTKERRSFTLDEEVDELLAPDHINASGLVNRLVRNHFTGGDGRQAMLELRAQQIRSEIDELEARAESKREELDRVEDELAEYQDAEETILNEAAEKLAETPLDQDNPAVQTWAERIGVDVDTLISEVRDRR